jgi:signal transduction histidine kinase/ligand-binding sensor domain-containing protein
VIKVSCRAIVVVLVSCTSAFALNPALDVNQYMHSAWRVREGLWNGGVTAIAQTLDGYLWLGTESGLLRFDGVRSVQWQPPPNAILPSPVIWSLLAGRDGTLWIGTAKGLASLKQGKLSRFDDLGEGPVYRILETRDGALWLTVGNVQAQRWMLCTIRDGGAECYGRDGGPGAGAIGLFEDSQGTLWVGVMDGVWQWKPGARRFYSLSSQVNGFQGLAETDNGELLIAMPGGIRRLRNGRAELLDAFPREMQDQNPRALLRDRDGGLWIATLRGLLHVHQQRIDAFNEATGLSGDSVLQMLEDREGNVWVLTRSGLDRFRHSPVAPMSARNGLANSLFVSLLASRDGSVWFGGSGGLTRLSTNNDLTAYRAPTIGTVASLLEDRRGRVWIATFGGVGYLDRGRAVPIAGIPEGATRGIVEDNRGVWVASQNHGLYELSPDGRVIRHVSWSGINRGSPATAIAADRATAGVWLGFADGRIVRVVEGQTQASYGTNDGLGTGIHHLHFDRSGGLWAATDTGLSRVHNGRVTTLTRKNGLPCDGSQWTVEDAHWFWIGTPCGLVRIARSELEGLPALADTTRAVTPMVRTTVFGSADGAQVMITGAYYTEPAVVANDGRVWFLSNDAVSVLDPRFLPFNTLPPPVHIEQVIADRKTYAAESPPRGSSLRLPPLVRDLQIDYTALSLVAPEKMRFRYKLEGHDADWQDVGTRRQAFYTNLPPGDYRFRAIASNNSGVWNETGASLDFAIAPAYYQTAWFRVLAVGLFTMLLATLYRLRVRQVARQYNARLEARIGERTRIARDLHDTLLQSFQGVLLKFHALSYTLGDRPESRQQLEAVIEQARQAITEGRNAVQGLRASTLPGNDLARAIITFGDELAVANGDRRAELHVHVKGASRDLASLVHDDVYRIACEAVRNAHKHAGARRIEVEIHYDERQLRLRIRDDGDGIDPGVLRQGARAGHYGLPGMHERARAIGGKLTVWSEVNSGTEIELTIPAGIAYAKASAALVPEET